jgi:hypothetical protein
MGDRRIQDRSTISGPVTLSRNTTVVFCLGAIAIGSVTDGARRIAVQDGGGSVTESRQSAEFTEASSDPFSLDNSTRNNRVGGNPACTKSTIGEVGGG